MNLLKGNNDKGFGLKWDYLKDDYFFKKNAAKWIIDIILFD